MIYPDREEIQSWLELSDQELLNMIGKEDVPFFPPLGPSPKGAEKAKSFFTFFEIIFYGKLCVQQNICKKIGEPGFGDNISLVLAVGDMIAGLITGIPPFQIAAFLVKSGIKKFCHCGEDLDVEKKKHYLKAADFRINALKSKLDWLNEKPEKNKEAISSTKETSEVLIELKKFLSSKKKRQKLSP